MSSAVPDKCDVKEPLLFECAWEVATNKVPGGIYTVINTKVPVTVVSEYGNKYCLVGSLSYKTAPMEVKVQEPEDKAMKQMLEQMQSRRAKLFYGRWLIEGSPDILTQYQKRVSVL